MLVLVQVLPGVPMVVPWVIRGVLAFLGRVGLGHEFLAVLHPFSGVLAFILALLFLGILS